MRKTLFSPLTCSFRKTLWLLALMAGFASAANAQCGTSALNEGGTVNPTTSWTAANVGSNTYLTVNVTAGQIYSFRYSSNGTGIYFWDMTLSSSSAIIGYNNSVTPVRDSWTGGEVCPLTPTPQSAEWVATYTGQLRVNTHAWNAGTCYDYIGASSAVLEYKTCSPAPDPGVGSNVWNVEAFVTTDLTIPQPYNRYGYYVDNNLSFNTTNYWGASSSPSSAAGWNGCGIVPNDNFVIRSRRQGFPCGVYKIQVDNVTDLMRISLNGTQIYSGGNVSSPTTVGLASGYVLSSTDDIEIVYNALCTTDNASVTLVPVTPPTLNGGTIGGVANNSVICEGSSVGTFTNVASATGGVSGFPSTTPITYDWQISTDNGFSWTSVGVNTPGWAANMTVPSGTTIIFRRVASDECGNTASSNTITVTSHPAPQGGMSPATQTICPGGTAQINLDFTSGTGPYNISYTDGANTYSVNGVSTGSFLTVNPALTSTYNFTLITDALGCSRNFGFTSGAVVQVAPAININSVTVTPVSCNGGNNGAIAVNASGGTAPYSYSIDNGATYQPNNSTFTGLPAGSYDVVVSDSLGCTASYAGNSVVISQPTAISVSTTFTDASCANVFDGSITVTATGGTGAYTYSLNGGPNQPGNVFNGLAAGTYTVMVFDANNCSGSDTVVIGNTYIISVGVDSQSNLTCAGANDGSVTVHVNGGIAPYTYSINGTTFQSSGTFSGLAGGTYIVIGRDSKGCTETVTVNIAQPAPITVTLDSITDVLCYGTGTGAIYITATGGTGALTFNWSNSTTNEDLTGVAGGVYNVTVSDANGCSTVFGATIDQPLELFLNVASTHNPLCNGDSSGYIDVIANGGVPAYTYAWSNGSAIQFQDALPAGSYTVTVTDANGCAKTLTQVLTDPTLLNSNIVGTDVSCFGASDGSADVTVTGGTAPYSFLWSAGLQNTEDVGGLSGGLHYVIITDYNGCSIRDSILINEAPQLVLSLAVTNISCFDANDGSIDLTVTGGTPAYNYAWSNGPTTEDINNLTAATYTVTVTDSRTCTASASALIVNPSAINTSFILTEPLCNSDSNGAVDLIPSGGTPAYTYNWNNGATTEDLANVPAGVYIVTITDTRGCIKVDSTTIIQPPIMYTSGYITNVSCNAYCDGEIDITAYGGTLPYNYAWSNGPSTEDILALCGGNYTVTVTDNHNCTVASLYIVVEPPVLTANITATNVSCNGGKNGTLAVAASGGVVPYEFLWNNFVTDSGQSGVGAGHYVVLVTDSNGCHTYDSVDVTQPAAIAITGVVTDVNCGGASTGAIDITVTGGTPAYTYAWTPGGTSEDLTNIAAGTYTVVVTDASSCTGTNMFVVNQGDSLSTNISTNNPLCFGSSNGFISVLPMGGTVPYTFNWNTTTPQTGAVATNLLEGTYTVTVTDARNCTATASATLTDPAQIAISTSPTDARCFNSANGIVVVTLTGGVAPFIYTLNGVTHQSNASTDTLTGLLPGDYVVEVQDANGCTSTQGFTINAPGSLSVDLTAPQATILQGMSTQLVAVAVSSPSSVVSYTWSPMDSFNVFNFAGCPDPDNCSSPYVTPRYSTTFMVTVMNGDSCYASDTISITVIAEPSEFIPTAFTPNGDGLNDRFEFDILGATDVSMDIYSRWGERVYSTANQPNGFSGTNGWDGTKDGKLLAYDTYVWQMKVTYFDGSVQNKSGTITIMK